MLLALALMAGNQEAATQVALAEKYENAGDYEDALTAYAKAGDFYSETGYGETGAIKLMEFAGRMEDAGRYEIAAKAYAKAGELYRIVGKGSYGVSFLVEFAGRAETAGKYEAAAIAYDAVAEIYAQMGYPQNDYYEKAADMRIKAHQD